jgi:hypothetical protein
MLHREAAHVQLVDHHFVPRHHRTPITAPGKGWIDHLALGHASCAVAPVERQIGALVAYRVAEQSVTPAHGADDALGVGV